MMLIFSVLSIGCLVSAQYADSPDYVAAVVEYHPARTNSFDAINIALEDYGNFIHEAKEKEAEIIVFPEATLNNYDGTAVEIPDENENAYPCNDTDNFSVVLSRLSCAAKVEKIYVLANIAEKFPCNETTSVECNKKGYLLFNTNVVFDRNGVIISRYRKINLFGEEGYTESVDQKMGVFDTDFGVKFGHFICFDLMFQKPAVQLLNKEQVKNVILSTMWFSEMPFLTAVQIQESWAATHNVNLLAAGANNPDVGSSGTGIYLGKNGMLSAIMNGEPKSQMLVETVPKIPPTSRGAVREMSNSIRDFAVKNNPPTVMDSLWLKQDNLTVYSHQLLEEVKEQSITLVNRGVECRFDIKMNVKLPTLREDGGNEYQYRAVAFDGVRSYTYKTGGVTNCAIVACTNASIYSCAKRFPDHSTVTPTNEFTEIKITAIVTKPIYNESNFAEDIVYHPVTLDTSIMPLGISTYSVEHTAATEATQQTITMTLLSGHYPNVLSVGIMGRVFSRDGQPVTGSSNIASASMLSIFLCSVFCIFNKLFL